jgi:malonyl-CoA/methylmalonyl-CoA synthetase
VYHARATNLLVATLLDAGRRTPEKAAVLGTDGATTYERLDALSAQLAHTLVDVHGVSRGDRVVVQLPKRPEVLALNIACARLGAIYVPVNPSYTYREVAELLEDATPVLLIGEEGVGGATPFVGRDELLDTSAAFPSSFEDEACDASTPAAILYTSGTTGRPKGAVLSHGNLEFGCRTLNDLWGITSTDVLVHALPLTHVHGLFVAAYCALSSGASMRLLDGFDVSEVIDALGEATMFMGVPTHYTRLLSDRRFTSQSVRGARLFVSGSAPMLRSTHDEFLARTGHRVLERYGTTETGMITSNPLRGTRKPGTVGPALPGVEIRVNGGPPGSIEVRGPNVFDGYWNRPGSREVDFTSDGFFITGDLGLLDEDGYLEIVGRSKDLIITGGLNVYPKEVEQVIDALPGVLESAVIGVPDADFGEAVTAVVVALPAAVLDEDDLRAQARTVLAPFKVPKRFVVVSELPRNSMGKVQKARLRHEVAELRSSNDE